MRQGGIERSEGWRRVRNKRNKQRGEEGDGGKRSRDASPEEEYSGEENIKGQENIITCSHPKRTEE